MKIRNLILLFVLTGILFTQYANSKVTTNSVTSYVVANQGILPNTGYSPLSSVIGRNASDEGYIIIFGLNIASDSGQRLNSVNLSMTGTLTIDSCVITNRDGTIIGAGPGVGTVTIPGGVVLPPNDTGGYTGNDFFIAVRTTDNCVSGTFGVFMIYPVSGVSISPPETGDVPTTGGTTETIICELIIADLLPVEFTNLPPLPPPAPVTFPHYPEYYQWQPGEMIRPRYDHIPFDYQYSPLPDLNYVPQVVAWETLTPVLAIGAAQRNVVASGFPTPFFERENLSSVTLTLTDIGIPDFDPSRSFRVLRIDLADINNPLTMPGITLWRDANNDGIWQPTDTLLMYQMSAFTPTGNGREWTVTLSPSFFAPITEQIDDISDGRYDYFIVIQLSSDDAYPTVETIGGDYKIWIQPGGVEFGPISHPRRFAGIRTDQVKTIYNNIYVADISPVRVDPCDSQISSDLTSNVIPLFGIDIAGGPQNLFPDERILSIRIDLLAFENMDPNDIAPLRSDSNSGLSLWRDNKTDNPLFIGGFS